MKWVSYSKTMEWTDTQTFNNNIIVSWQCSKSLIPIILLGTPKSMLQFWFHHEPGRTLPSSLLVFHPEPFSLLRRPSEAPNTRYGILLVGRGGYALIFVWRCPLSYCIFFRMMGFQCSQQYLRLPWYHWMAPTLLTMWFEDDHWSLGAKSNIMIQCFLAIWTTTFSSPSHFGTDIHPINWDMIGGLLFGNMWVCILAMEIW